MSVFRATCQPTLSVVRSHCRGSGKSTGTMWRPTFILDARIRIRYRVCQTRRVSLFPKLGIKLTSFRVLLFLDLGVRKAFRELRFFQDTFRQIHIDIPRMCPLIPLFQQKLVQEVRERLLDCPIKSRCSNVFSTFGRCVTRRRATSKASTTFSRLSSSSSFPNSFLRTWRYESRIYRFRFRWEPLTSHSSLASRLSSSKRTPSGASRLSSTPSKLETRSCKCF